MQNKIVIDLDGTLARSALTKRYEDCEPDLSVVEQLRFYKKQGFEIAVYTARNMRTHRHNLGRINAVTLPGIIAWLQRHNIPYDEIHVGKPWCGPEGFYVDDRAIRPSEFATLSPGEIHDLLGTER